jgi:hypothetical protein
MADTLASLARRTLTSGKASPRVYSIAHIPTVTLGQHIGLYPLVLRQANSAPGGQRLCVTVDSFSGLRDYGGLRGQVLRGQDTNCAISRSLLRARLSRPEPLHPSPPHTKPSTSWKHELPKFWLCQWSSTAEGDARIARRKTGVSRRPMRAPLSEPKLRKRRLPGGRRRSLSSWRR